MHQPPSRVRMVLTATAAALGGAVAWWHWRAPWVAALSLVTGSLLILALASGRGYRPVHRVLDAIVRSLLQGFTWLILGIVFALVFVPGRLVLALRRRDPLERRPDPIRTTYWRNASPPLRNTAAPFRRQF